MADSHNHHNQLHSNGGDDGLSQDAQGPWWEMLSPTQVLTGEQQQQQIVKAKKKKCRGNRKLQHYKRKWRARGLTEEEITTLIRKRNTTISEQLLNDKTTTIHEQIKESNKRKRDQPNREELLNSPIKSMSQLFISQETATGSKKMKKSTYETMSFSSFSNSDNDNSNPSNQDNNFTLYKPSKYLKMPRKLLLHSLHLQLDDRLKWKKKEQRFLLSRLELFDQQFCLDQICDLYRVYFDQGLQYQMWPDDILKIIPSNEPKIIQKYLEDYLILLQNKINQYTIELMTQSSSYPMTFLPRSRERIDQRLKEFVRLHHLDLTRQINYHINKLKDNIRGKQLFHELSSYTLTNEQQQVIDRLIRLHQKRSETLEEMTMLEVRINCKVLPKSINALDHISSFDDSIDSIPNENNNNENILQLSTIEKHRKKIRDYKRQILANYLEDYELNIEENEYLYQQELAIFECEISKQNDQVDQIINYLRAYLNHQTNKTIRAIRYKSSLFRVKLLHPRHHRRRSTTTTTSTKKTISIYPEAIIEISSDKLFTDNELALLSSIGGPSYIRSNQSFFYKQKKLQKQTKKEYDTIIDKITSILLDRHRLSRQSLSIKQLYNHLETIFNERYSSSSLSYLDIYHARKDLELIHSIKRKLKQGQYIIRVTDKSGVFHIGEKSDYDKKVEIYQLKTGAYIELLLNPLMDTFYKVVHLLNDLNIKKQIKVWQYNKMMPNKKKIQLAYLYFIPKPHKEGTPLRPIVSSINAPTTGISKMLDQLIRPLFDQYVKQTTIVDGVDLIRRLEKYVNLGLLKPTTHLCTFDITDLYTMLPQEESICILKKFLLHFNHQHIQGMTIEAIEHLARIVLTENVFIYNNKYYRQILGGAMGSPFTLTLANIFMWNWEQKLIENQENANELYGRYIDDIFLTSNESIEKLHEMLNNANTFHPNIKLVRNIGHIVPYLDVLVRNNNGLLETSVYHKEAAEPYVVPFKSDHPRHVFANIIHGALIRAIRYSSTLKVFNHERRTIKLMLLYNSYPTTYIYSQFKKFFVKHSILSTSILPIIDNENEFIRFRHQLLPQPTISEHARASRIASQLDYKKVYPNIDPLVKSKLLKRQNKENTLLIHYTHESRFAHYKSKIHQKWHEIFENTPIMETTLIVGTRNNPNLTKEFVRKSPYIKASSHTHNNHNKQNQ